MQFALDTTDLRSALEFVLHWPEPFMVLKFCSLDRSQSGVLWIKDAKYIVGAAAKPTDYTGYRAMLEIAKRRTRVVPFLQAPAQPLGVGLAR